MLIKLLSHSVCKMCVRMGETPEPRTMYCGYLWAGRNASKIPINGLKRVLMVGEGAKPKSRVTSKRVLGFSWFNPIKLKIPDTFFGFWFSFTYFSKLNIPNYNCITDTKHIVSLILIPLYSLNNWIPSFHYLYNRSMVIFINGYCGLVLINNNIYWLFACFKLWFLPSINSCISTFVLNFQLTFKFYVGQHFSDWLPNVCPKSRTIISLGLIKENLTQRRWRPKKACYNNNSINLKPTQNEAEKARADRPKT